MYKFCSILIWQIFQLILLCNCVLFLFGVWQILLSKFLLYYCLHYILPRILRTITRKCWYSMQINFWWWAVPQIRVYLMSRFYSECKLRKFDAREIYTFYSNVITYSRGVAKCPWNLLGIRLIVCGRLHCQRGYVNIINGCGDLELDYVTPWLFAFV